MSQSWGPLTKMQLWLDLTIPPLKIPSPMYPLEDTAWSRTDKDAMAEAHAVAAQVVLYRYVHSGPDSIETRIDVPKMEPKWAAREFVKLALALDPSIFEDHGDPLTWEDN